MRKDKIIVEVEKYPQIYDLSSFNHENNVYVEMLFRLKFTIKSVFLQYTAEKPVQYVCSILCSNNYGSLCILDFRDVTYQRTVLLNVVTDISAELQFVLKCDRVDVRVN